MSRLTTYEIVHEDDGVRVWVIADREMWLPGGYDTDATARAAARLSDEALADLNARVYSIHGENRPITMADVEGAR